ncbi:MAG: pentapeptide repeat-containing protein, partial [Hyphomicrobiaceae bacterium]|nr:pentapeptide repeat-containing protein [Hyphomicrobiaceae bacterium]
MSFLTPQEFENKLKAGDWTGLAGKTVQGRINLAGSSFDQPIRLSHMTFHGDVDFSDCAFGGSVFFEGCAFARNLRMENSEVDGSLFLRNVTIRGGASQSGKRFAGQYALEASGLVVRGDLCLDLIEVTDAAGTDPKDRPWEDGSICLRGAGIEGNLTALGA